MNEINDFKQLRQNYSSALENNIQKLQGRLKALNNNIINTTSEQKIIMTKNPSEIKSLRSSCLFNDNNLGSPTDRFDNSQVFANFNRYSSLEVPQARQGIQQHTHSPDVFENIFLKQSYIPYEQKQIKQGSKGKTKNTQSNTLKTTKRNEKINFGSPSKPNSQSLQNIKKKNDTSQDKTLKKIVEKKKNLPPPGVPSKTKNSSRSPLKQKNKQAKQQTPIQIVKKPLNEVLKKFTSSKASLSRTVSKSKSKSKSKSPEQNNMKQYPHRQREQAIHHYNEQITSQFSPTQDQFQSRNNESSSNLLRQVRTLSKRKVRQKNQSQQQLTNPSPNKVSEVHTMRLKHLLKNKNHKQDKNVRAQIKTAESPIQIKQYKLQELQVPQIKSLEDQPKDDSKPSSVRLNTLSIQRSENNENSLLMNIFHELQQLSDDQIFELQQYLRQLKVEKKDEQLQTSIQEIINNQLSNQKSSQNSNQKPNMIETHLKMALEEFPKKSYTSSPQSNNVSFNFKKELISSMQIEEICHQREKSIKLRVNTQIQAFQNLLSQQKISPRSFHHNKQLVQSWFTKQAEQLQKFKMELQKVQRQSSTLLKKSEQDVIMAKDLKKDQMLVLSQLQQMSFDQSEIKDESYLDQSDLQFSLPNSPKIVTPSSKFFNQYQQQQSISQQKQNQVQKQLQQEPKKKEYEISTFNDEQFVGTALLKPLQVSPNNDQKQIISYKEPQIQMVQGLDNVFKIEEATEKVIELLLDEASTSLNKIEFINQLAIQSNSGILTNLGVINSYLNYVCQYILQNCQQEFINRMNFPYGRMPISRLRQIHGQDDNDDHHDQQPLYLIKQIDESQNQYEKIHNQAIFDAFNESLNSFRPFYYNSGIPYPWCYSSNTLTVIIINQDNLPLLLEKAKQKVLEWATTLCGLLSDDDMPFISITKLTYEQMIQLYQCSENDTLNQMREERLQNCVELELQDEERKWFQDADENTEVLIEMTDYIFEELIEEMVLDLLIQ